MSTGGGLKCVYSRRQTGHTLRVRGCCHCTSSTLFLNKKDFCLGPSSSSTEKGTAWRQDHLHPIWTITKAKSKYTALFPPYPTRPLLRIHTQPQGQTSSSVFDMYINIDDFIAPVPMIFKTTGVTGSFCLERNMISMNSHFAISSAVFTLFISSYVIVQKMLN